MNPPNLRLRKKRPEFRRQEYFKQKKLERTWRRPKGRKSKARMNEQSRGPHPSPGYSSPKALRGLNRQGLREVRVFNPAQLDPLTSEAVVIASTVGRKKRLEILKKAGEKGLKVSNI